MLLAKLSDAKKSEVTTIRQRCSQLFMIIRVTRAFGRQFELKLPGLISHSVGTPLILAFFASYFLQK